MPPFGLAHKLLSSRHKDTSPPAAGADPDEGQLATWSTALGAWIAADAPEGVTDHGLLSGLYPDDDHEQYALADKSRPSPWVAGGDLAARSLADLGTVDHDLLDGLTDDDHSIYALLTGRSGGQLLKGGLAASEHLTLQSTAHATRGYVRAQDDLQLLTNIIRDAAGTARVTLAATAPELTLTGDVRVMGNVAVAGSRQSDSILLGVWPIYTSAAQAPKAVEVGPTLTMTHTSPQYIATSGYAIVKHQANVTSGFMRGLDFIVFSWNLGGYSCALDELTALKVQPVAFKFGSSHTITDVYGLNLVAPSVILGATATAARGIFVAGGNFSWATTAYALHLEDITGAGAICLMEIGPATPYLRLLGGGDPAANQSNLLLKLGATLKLVTEHDADSAGVGFRALRVPN